MPTPHYPSTPGLLPLPPHGGGGRHSSRPADDTRSCHSGTTSRSAGSRHVGGANPLGKVIVGKVQKQPRYDRWTGKPNQNLFQPEVMAALRWRGGATWLRGMNSEHNLQGHDALDAGHSLYAAIKTSGNIQQGRGYVTGAMDEEGPSSF